ncbi:MAG: hypothetical protein M3N16_04545 [Actinomycetota bacterium]|nr:hypothetical protein [Actinomycetota bacterium]
MAVTGQERPVTLGMRTILVVGGALVAVAGVQLFILSEETDRWFAFTVVPPLTAAFLGAFYFAACVLAWLSAREREWSRARPGIPGVVAFVWLTGIATLVHLDKFALDSSDPVTAELAWAWVLIYFLEPPILLALFVHQLRVPGGDPPRRHRLPTWFRGLSVALGAALVVIGAVLFVAPTGASELWPWTLNALTGRLVAAWLVAQGAVFVQVAWEDEWGRLGPTMAACVAIGALQLAALGRYSETIDWSRPGAWAYLAVAAGVLLVGLYGWPAARRAVSGPTRPAASAVRPST